MTTKFKIFELLEANRGSQLSGENLAKLLNISRNSVWKAIKQLQEQGHLITAVTNCGYTLQDSSDKLSSFGISKYIKSGCDLEITVLETVDSTNIESKRMLNLGASKNFCIVSEVQTNGQGRRGKSFHSPSNGIYFSLTINGELPISDTQFITCNAAVAVCRAIEELSADTPQIKWVNDILVNGKKVCGILTEGILDFETNTMKSVVIGIGINCKVDALTLPTELTNIVGAVNLNDTRNKMIATVINNIFQQMNFTTENIMSEYISRSMIIGKNITYMANNKTVSAVVTAINSMGNLVATGETGDIITLSSGLIEIKGLYNGI